MPGRCRGRSEGWGGHAGFLARSFCFAQIAVGIAASVPSRSVGSGCPEACAEDWEAPVHRLAGKSEGRILREETHFCSLLL